MSIQNGKTDVPFYERDISFKIAGIMSLAGCVFMLAGTFFYWISLFVKTTETEHGGISIFKAVWEVIRGDRRIGTILPAFFLVLFYAAVVLLFIIALKDNFLKQPFLINRKKRIRLGLVVLTIVLLIIILNLPAMKANLGRFYDLRDSWKSFIQASKDNNASGSEFMSCHLTPGLGAVLYVLGVLSYIGSVVFNFILDTLNED